MKFTEVNFDGLVGPSHNYAGLSLGNLASKNNANLVSHPKAAAIQGLDKMQRLLDLGQVQGIIPPLPRPNVAILKQLGFTGSIENILQHAFKTDPQLLASCYSASNMWTANAATVTASKDAANGKVNFTAANLTSQFHRSIEAQDSSAQLQQIFSDPDYFIHHPPLPAHYYFADEGAANHTRLAPCYKSKGLNLFVYGKDVNDSSKKFPIKYPARQTLQACQAIVRNHQIPDDQVVYIQQKSNVIDAGVFHNDVIAVGNLTVLFYHQEAFQECEKVLNEIKQKWEKISNKTLYLIAVDEQTVSVKNAIKSYLFNTQLIESKQQIVLLAPTECKENKQVNDYLNKLVNEENPIAEIIYQDVKQSMKNGGGPACLRLRVCLSEAELAAVNSSFLLSSKNIQQLKNIINEYYPENLTLENLATVATYQQIQQANKALQAFFN